MRTDRPPFHLLAAFQALAGLAVLPPVLTEQTDVDALLALCAASWLLLAAINSLGADHLSLQAFEFSLFSSSMIAAIHGAFTPRAQMQVLDGLELLVLGMFAAFALSDRGVHVWVAVSGSAYLLAWLVNPLPIGMWLGAVIVAMVAGTTTVMRRLILQVRSVSRHDPLTGALNRWGLADQCEIVLALSARTGNPLSVAFLDLDGFKGFNDRHGHLAGDRLLIDLVVALRGNLRATDLVARVGGDEFVLILPGVTSLEATKVIDRLLPALPIAVTYGVTDWQPGEDLASVIDMADRRMYQRKPTRLKNRQPSGDASEPR